MTNRRWRIGSRRWRAANLGHRRKKSPRTGPGPNPVFPTGLSVRGAQSTRIWLPEQGMLMFRKRKKWVIEGHNVSDGKDTKNEEGKGIAETRRAEHSREAGNVQRTHRRSRRAKAEKLLRAETVPCGPEARLTACGPRREHGGHRGPGGSEPRSRPLFIHLPASSRRFAALRCNSPKFS